MTDILRPIGVISRALDSIANVEFKQVNLSKGQYLYLVRIGEAPGIILERLAEELKVDKTTAARAVQKLETVGFLSRRQDPDNKKIRRLYLTAEGERIAPFIERENNYSNDVALSGFTSDEADQLRAFLDRVSKNIDADWQTVKKGGQRNY